MEAVLDTLTEPVAEGSALGLSDTLTELELLSLRVPLGEAD